MWFHEAFETVVNAPWNAQAVNINFSLFFPFFYNVLLSKIFTLICLSASLHRFLQKIYLWPGFFSLIPSNLPLTRENYAIKSWAILQDFSSSMITLTKKSILTNYQIAKCIFCLTVNFIIQELKFCKITQLSENLREQVKNLRYKNLNKANSMQTN